MFRTIRRKIDYGNNFQDLPTYWRFVPYLRIPGTYWRFHRVQVRVIKV